MADTSVGGSQETPSPRPPPPRPRAALRPQSNRAPTASSAAAAPSTTASAAAAPSSSAATMPTSAQPQHTAAAGVAESTETGGTPCVIVDEDDDVPIVKKRKLKFEDWLGFDQVTIAARQKAQCHWCKKILVAHGKAGTNHLHGHLKMCASCQVRKNMQQSTLKLGGK
jgi:hypothetical protein